MSEERTCEITIYNKKYIKPMQEFALHRMRRLNPRPRKTKTFETFFKGIYGYTIRIDVTLAWKTHYDIEKAIERKWKSLNGSGDMHVYF